MQPNFFLLLISEDRLENHLVQEGSWSARLFLLLTVFAFFFNFLPLKLKKKTLCV